MIAKNGGAALSLERDGASGAATMQAGMRGAVLARASGCTACLLQASARSPRRGTRPMHRLAAVTQQLTRAMRWPLFIMRVPARAPDVVDVAGQDEDAHNVCGNGLTD